jgi:hypothetical protein
MGKSMKKLESSRSPMEEREKSTFLFLHELNSLGRRERHWRGREEV